MRPCLREAVRLDMYLSLAARRRIGYAVSGTDVSCFDRAGIWIADEKEGKWSLSVIGEPKSATPGLDVRDAEVLRLSGHDWPILRPTSGGRSEECS